MNLLSKLFGLLGRAIFGVGFTYLVEVVRPDGSIDHAQTELVHNLVPTEGLNHILGVTFKGVTQVTSWFLAPFEGNFTPLANSTAANLPAAATECTAYAEGTRQAFTSGAVAGGSIDNSASRAQFTLNADKTIYGAWLTSAAAKGATIGVCVSAVKFGTPKVLSNGSVLQLTAGLTATST